MSFAIEDDVKELEALAGKNHNELIKLEASLYTKLKLLYGNFLGKYVKLILIGSDIVPPHTVCNFYC